ncbi:hypothetical protein HMPREF1992_00763 [Selenomonas sp. oral taxon 892 str. F0426]|nr:hypothetical protein HMPREF1992_00763 [Selenomonas sp. oral taxon 892 str. F0426]
MSEASSFKYCLINSVLTDFILSAIPSDKTEDKRGCPNGAAPSLCSDPLQESD